MDSICNKNQKYSGNNDSRLQKKLLQLRNDLEKYKEDSFNEDHY
jgi:hypothetical protein